MIICRLIRYGGGYLVVIVGDIWTKGKRADIDDGNHRIADIEDTCDLDVFSLKLLLHG